MHERRLARECAVKSLYANTFNNERIEVIVNDIMKREELPSEIHGFCKELTIRTSVHKDEFDKLIQGKSEHWEFNRIALLDKIILRMAICELLYYDDIPPKVSISEAIELAKDYSTENSGSFVNGILDSILKDLKEQGRIFAE